MFWYDLIGHLQEDVCNVCSLCFNLTIIEFSHVIKIGVVLGYG